MNEEQIGFAANYSISVYGLSEKSVTVVFGAVISKELWCLITSFNQLLLQNPFPGLITTVPAYCTLTVFFDPLKVAEASLPGKTCYEKVTAYLKKMSVIEPDQLLPTSNTVVIPVCYGGNFGTDISTVAQTSGLTEAEVIKQHSAGQYTVYMMGFVPGFAYMGGMPPSLATPRKAVPSAKIPAGSIGIAGLQTGIYPMEIPGGWQIIGRTPLQLFDARRKQPALLKGGDLVIFKAIAEEEFNAYTE